MSRSTSRKARKSTAPSEGSQNMSLPTAMAKGIFSRSTLRDHLRADALQVQVGDALVVRAHEGDGVAAPIGVVAGVEAEADALRVGVREQALDLIFVFDVRLGVRVEDEAEAEVVAGDVGGAVRRPDEPLPCLVVQSLRRDLLAGEEIRVRVVNQDDELAAERLGERPAAAHLPLHLRPALRGVQVGDHRRAGDA